jgi:hypothetical protein
MRGQPIPHIALLMRATMLAIRNPDSLALDVFENVTRQAGSRRMADFRLVREGIFKHAEGPLLLPVLPRALGFDQAFEPVGERAAICLRKPLSHRLDGFPDPHMHRGLASFRFRLFHQGFLAKRYCG